MSLEPAPPLLLAAVLLAAAAAWFDLRTGLIPNRLVAIGAGALLLLCVGQAALAGGAAAVPRALAVALAGGLCTALVPLILYRAGGIGGGDVKLLFAIGLGLGPLAGLEAELYAFGLTLLYAPARLAYEGTLLRTLAASTSLLLRPFLPAARRAASASERSLATFRFGPPVFLATLLTTVLHLGGMS